MGSNKKEVAISPVLPFLPAVSKRHKLQHRSNSTWSMGDKESPGRNVFLQTTADGKLQAYRSAKEREKTPDRIHLDRRGLTTIPELVDEGQLRFLSLQHNLLTTLVDINTLKLKFLVFLDLYDNKLEKIQGLGGLDNLRVLLMGKNRLRQIEGVEKLTKLEVLDLHGNQVTHVSNLSNLKELKVLNLAGNLIRDIGPNDLKGLKNLQELNLRKNKIRTVSCFGEMQQLKKLYLSNNDIQRLELKNKNLNRAVFVSNWLEFTDGGVEYTSILVQLLDNYMDKDVQALNSLVGSDAFQQWLADLHNVTLVTSLIEMSINGNPVSLSSECVSFLVSHLPNLQILSNMQVTEQVSKAAESWLLNRGDVIDPILKNGDDPHSPVAYSLCDEVEKDENKNGILQNQIAPIKLPPLQTGSLNNESDHTLSDSDIESTGPDKNPGTNMTYFITPQKPKCYSTKHGTKTNYKAKEQASDYLIEINGRVLSVFGQGALRFIDRPWNPSKAGDVTSVKFSSINFDNLTLVLNKMKMRFPCVEHFTFIDSNIYCLGQLNALADIQGLTSLEIASHGNPITQKEWRNYAIYRLSHWGLRIINNIPVTESEFVLCEREFKGLGDLVVRCLPEDVLEPLIERLQLEKTVSDPRNWLESAEPAIRSVVAKEALQWSKFKQDNTWRNRGKSFLEGIIDATFAAVVKLQILDTEWPEILHGIVRDTLVDYSQLDTYMKQSLAKVKL